LQPPPAPQSPAEGPVSPELTRRLAQRRPDAYALVAHGLRPAAHHRQWLTELREAVNTPGSRTLLIAPPGSAKSTYASLVLPLWYLGNHPDRAVLALTSSDTMAGQFHGVVELALRTSTGHRAVFGDDAGQPDQTRGWSSDGLFLRGVPPAVKDPSYRCAGFGTAVIGSRCHLLILDDPVTQKTSTSPTEMTHVRSELDGTILTRLHPDGSAVAIMTRWAEEDTAAHLIKQGWRLVLMPALGDYPWLTEDDREPETGLGSIWPGRWSLDWLLAERRRLGASQWSTIWMGNPIAVGVGPFQSAEWFRPLPESYPQIASRLVRLTGIDVAWSSKQTADETVALTVGFDPADAQRRLYILGLFRRQIDAVDEQGTLAAVLAEHLIAVRPHGIGVELDPFRQTATAQLIIALREQLMGKLPAASAVYGVPVATDKVTRARPLAAHAEAGLLHVDKQSSWWLRAEPQFLGFPLASHDDCVDAGSIATAMALGAIGQTAAAKPAELRFGGRKAA
jgi:predicted phage terminase large subunit-like protein